MQQADGYRYAAFLADESGSDEPCGLLAEGMFEHSPFVTFRWVKGAGELYGRSPVMTALPDIKTANKVVELILKNASIAVTGIWLADDDGVLNPANIKLVPGSIIPKAVGSAGLTPLQAPGRFDVSQLVLDDLRVRIRHTLLTDRLGPVVSRKMTATEVLERSSEMTRLLGAMFGRLQAELLNPLLNRGGRHPAPARRAAGAQPRRPHRRAAEPRAAGPHPGARGCPQRAAVARHGHPPRAPGLAGAEHGARRRAGSRRCWACRTSWSARQDPLDGSGRCLGQRGRAMAARDQDAGWVWFEQSGPADASPAADLREVGRSAASPRRRPAACSPTCGACSWTGAWRPPGTDAELRHVEGQRSVVAYRAGPARARPRRDRQEDRF